MKPKPFQVKHVDIVLGTCCANTPYKKLIRLIYNEILSGPNEFGLKLNVEFDNTNDSERINGNLQYLGLGRTLFVNIDSYLEVIKVYHTFRSKPIFLNFHHDSLRSVIRHFKSLITCQN